MNTIILYPELEVEFWDLADRYKTRALASVGQPDGFATQEEALEALKDYKERLATRLIQKANTPTSAPTHEKAVHSKVVETFHKNQLYETKPYLRKVDQAKEERARLNAIFQSDNAGALDELKRRIATEASSTTHRRLTKTEFYILQILLFGDEFDRFVTAYQILSKTATDRIFDHNAGIVDSMGTMDIFGPYIENLDSPLMPNLPEFTSINNDALHRARAQPLVGSRKTPSAGSRVPTVFDDPPSAKVHAIVRAMIQHPIWSSPELNGLTGAGFVPLTQDANGSYGFNTSEMEQPFFALHQRVEALSKMLRTNAYSALKATGANSSNHGGRGRGGRGRGNHQQAPSQQQHPQQQQQQQPNSQYQQAAAPNAVF